MDVYLSLEVEQLEGAMDHPPRCVGGVGRDFWVTATERDVGLGGRACFAGYPFVEGEGLVDGGEEMKSVRAEGAYGKAQIDFGMRTNAGRHRYDSSLAWVAGPN